MDLELKHIAPYLPYKLKCLRRKEIFILNGLRDWIGWSGYFDDKYGSTAVPISVIKPILRPMSDLTRKVLEEEGFDSHIDYLTHEMQNEANANRLDSKGRKLWRIEHAPYEMVAYLFREHFDVFGLIDAGLAIDINTI